MKEFIEKLLILWASGGALVILLFAVKYAPEMNNLSVLEQCVISLMCVILAMTFIVGLKQYLKK